MLPATEPTAAWLCLGDSAAWLEGIAEAKIAADFAGEAMAADAAVMRDIAPLKHLACAGMRRPYREDAGARDLAEMFCKRMAQGTKLAKAELAEIRVERRSNDGGLQRRRVHQAVRRWVGWPVIWAISSKSLSSWSTTMREGSPAAPLRLTAGRPAGSFAM